jgi:exoribonuclease R
MARRRLRLVVSDGPALREGFAAVRRDCEVPDEFSPEVLAEAAATAAAPGPRPELDLTDLGFLTIDPPGSMDLDQAMLLRRLGSGYRVAYAIADVASFVRPGGALDAEARRRGETLYLPDERTPLHPPVLSEGAASLLPDRVRPALVWTIDLDTDGERVGVDVRRALVRSERRLDYEGVQRQIDDGSADEQLKLLAEIGRLREERERDRGGVALPVPEQEVVARDGGYALGFRVPLPVDGWNAQISLLTGMAAAELMLDGRVGILRTLPPPVQDDIDRLRRIALGLGVEWEASTSYADVVRHLDARRPTHAALLEEATTLLRGAGYVAFDGEAPEQPLHGALAAPYAHVTAPLRRLVDRYAGEVCVSLCSGEPVPEWVHAALPDVPAAMASADRRARAVERASIDLVEAAILEPHVGQTYDAVVVDVDGDKGTVQLADPAVRGRCAGADLPLGQRLRVRLVEADIGTRTGAVRAGLTAALRLVPSHADHPDGPTSRH